MKKTIIIHILAGLCYGGGAIWGIIEGLKYFIKDQPVNWLFLLPLLGGIVVALLNIILSLFKFRY